MKAESLVRRAVLWKGDCGFLAANRQGERWG